MGVALDVSALLEGGSWSILQRPFGAPYHLSRQKCGRPGEFADLYITPAREAELIVTFKEATPLEVDF